MNPTFFIEGWVHFYISLDGWVKSKIIRKEAVTNVYLKEKEHRFIQVEKAQAKCLQRG